MEANEDRETSYLRHPRLDRNRSSSSRSLASLVLGGLSFAGDGELQLSHLPLPTSVYVFDLVLTHGVRRIFRPPIPHFHHTSRERHFFTHVPRRNLSPFLVSLPFLYSAPSAPALVSCSSGRSCARSRHSTLSFSSGDASLFAVPLILRPTFCGTPNSSYIKRHCLAGSLTETDRSPLPLSVLRVS